MKEIPPKFRARIEKAKQQGLKELDLSNDYNTDDIDRLKEIPPEVFELEQLESLNLRNNNITTIPQDIARLQNLQSLDLWQNRLSEFPRVLGKLPNLLVLRLKLSSLKSLPGWLSQIKDLSLDLSGTKRTTLPRSITKLSNLTELDLTLNQITHLSESIGKLSNLRKLNLSANSITKLPESIGKLSNLTGLYLTWNKITKLPESIGNLSNLTVVNLRKNKITKLPESIGKLSNLTALYLSENKIKNLPESIGKLSNLTELDWTANNITNLPESIGKLSNLTKLDLSGNKITNLPESIGKLSNLTELDLSGNKITNLPESIAKLSNLTNLNLSSNQITNLPESIANLSNLTNLDLSLNKIKNLPESIANLSNLTNLDLSSNQITNLPESIANLSNLTNLDLSLNKIKNLPESIAKLSNLTGLYLWENRIKNLPESVTELSNLTDLDLSTNKIKNLPESIGKLSNLTQLELGYNKITNLPESITKLSNLTNLDLTYNKITNLPKSITKLSNLTNLNLTWNQITNLPESIGQLSNLKKLNLTKNQITNLPDLIANLSNLRNLNLSENQITNLPESITKLSNLTELHLSGNQITNLPESITKLSNLRSLDLWVNQITNLPESITKLSNLTNLYLSKNQITNLPESITNLSNLSNLSLSGNQITNLPESIGNLSNLTELDLSENQIKNLPESIANLSNLKKLDLSDNPLVTPPLEIAEKGIEAIRDYFQQIKQDSDYLYEAKLLIVGEAGAGKTTLAKKIQNPDYQLQEEDSTRGIDVISWYFSYNNQRDFRMNIWDFGGQEIYHATHQFFLTKRSLYTLVIDTRKEDTDFYYWLNIVELLSENSPLLIIKNEKQDREREINERGLRGQFTNLEKTLATNLKTNRGLTEILTQVKHYITNLPHVGDKLPKTWKQVREVLEQDQRDYISLEEYLRICQANGITERKYKLQLSGYLHDLGVCLHFQDDPLLNKTVILKPEWGTAAVYKVLDNDTVRNNWGKFTKQDLANIWQGEEYENAQAELLQLMIKFKLCYKIPNTKETYIAPQLLTEEEPTYSWAETNNLILRYTYEFMPKGILTQFIVAMHKQIWQQEYVWKSGVILEKDQTKAEVIEYYGKREIKIRVEGKYKRDLLHEVTLELDKIHDSYQRLKYNKLIPCNCQQCHNNQDPHFYKYNKLKERIAYNQLEIQCDNPPYHTVQVLSLIDDTMDLRKSIEDEDERKRKTHEAGGFSREITQLIINNNVNKQEGDKMERNIQISQSTVNNSNLGDVSGIVNTTINQLPESNSQEQEIKKLLSQLQEAISNETSLKDEDKTDALEEVKNLAEATQNPDEGKKKTADKAIRMLKRILNGLPTATEVVLNLDKLLQAIFKLPGLGG